MTAVVALTAAGQLGFSCQRPPGCVEPFSPVGGDQDRIGQEPTGVWPVSDSATYRPIPPGPLDTDGDGVTDTIDSLDDGRTLVVHRSSGDLTLTVDAPAFLDGYSADGVRAGDVDGDGRGDLLVRMWIRPSTGQGGDYPPRSDHLVSGATPDGVHAFSTVASTLEPANEDPNVVIRPMGDVDGDGRAELARVHYYDEAHPEESYPLWRGSELDLTPGTTQPEPSLEPPGITLIGPVPLDGRNAVALFTGQADERSYEVMLWLPEGGITFTTVGALPIAVTGPMGGGMAPEQIRVADDGHDRWLVASFFDRGGGERWAWDLDHLCANTPPAPIED